MAFASDIKGFDQVMKNLNKEIQAIEGRTEKGLIKAAIKVRRDMEHVPPLIPMDTGNLRASWFIVSAKKVETEKGTFVGDNAAEVEEAYNAAVTEARYLVTKLSGTSAVQKNIFIIMGFGANYSSPVHEMMDPKIVWKKANSGPKFFEKAVKANRDTILKIIAKEAKIQ